MTRSAVSPRTVCDLSPALSAAQYQQDYLSVGPPVYFVVRDGLNYSDVSVQNRICSTVNCARDSVGTQIAMAAQQPARSVVGRGRVSPGSGIVSVGGCRKRTE